MSINWHNREADIPLKIWASGIISWAIMAFVIVPAVGCGKSQVESETKPIYDQGDFSFVETRDIGVLNSWRQKNFDRNILNFDRVDDGYILHHVPNDNNIRQVFITEEVISKWNVENLDTIQKKYMHQEIVDFERYYGDYIILLQDKLHPYEVSNE